MDLTKNQIIKFKCKKKKNHSIFDLKLNFKKQKIKIKI